MIPKEKLTAMLVWGLLASVIVGVVFFFIQSEKAKVKLPVYGEVQPFNLTNQHDQLFQSSSMLGKVWVADVIFTRCPGPCPKMTEKMNELAETFRANSKVEFVTITTDPLHDTPSILTKYARAFGAADKPWHFLTGDKPAIQHAAVDSLKMVAREKLESEQQNVNDLFIHTTVFVLVDKKGRIRGTFESLEPDSFELMTQAIRSLTKERP